MDGRTGARLIAISPETLLLRINLAFAKVTLVNLDSGLL